MIRFIDFGNQIDPEGPRTFGFYDTDMVRFRAYGTGRHDWPSWRSFADQMLGFDESDLDDLRAICPTWVFEVDGTGSAPESAARPIGIPVDTTTVHPTQD